ncbi:progestin and adipoQ receptor family member 3 [Trichogramma pretiosum]|uniref:progestin and adipoQ receptor family member 3 n=1 Tax=Trichogramma pretiosum TaxID=7493 RepID=UPI0006C95E35|nr:progestin and adipoQ receptor family member 3 [Trichogramma pretiosum]XP_023318356.1 progestin and adipoQ receptor family member 3 [Trichogramma pretiosum]XP_023318357.1 progestin and adipoQ receptor family member 3 [Trichogramma pretiosum]XP_023318358.1 progestin and adipoQ receptor family member 3 [Trichogramma pretiosum]
MMKMLAGVEEVSTCTMTIQEEEIVDDHQHAHNNNSPDKPTSQDKKDEAASQPLVDKLCESSKVYADSPIKGPVTPEDEEKMRKLLPWHLAPEYLRHNPYILSGYRGYLTTKLCIESIFWWTNETINIWSHIFGFALFCCLTFYDLYLVNISAPFGDKVLCALLLVCFQACMILSSIYHTFSCRSEKDYWYFLSYDLLGVALSLLAIYMSGVYYAFWCHKTLQRFYLITILAIFIVAMMLQMKRYQINENIKLAVFVGWAVYGVVPTLHWTVAMGGMQNPIVSLLLPRVLGMYCISGAAFLIYFSKMPERLFPGWVDYIGSSHQWWHVLVVAALYYWHNTGMMYVEYRLNNGCPGLSQL